MVEWKKYKLSDIGEIKTGKTPPSKCNGAFSSYGIPFVTPVDMKGQKWISKTERYITKNGLETVKNYLVPKNSISVSCIGSDMGKAVLLKKESVTNQQINTLVVDDKHNYEYIYYVLSLMQGYFKSISGGSATPILNKSDFSKIEIELPSLDMQTKLVEYVRYFDEKIELNTQTAQTLETIAQTIFKSWFVDFDPIHAKINAIENGEDPTLAAMQAISCKNPEELHRLQTENPQEYRELEKLANAFPSEIGEDGVPKGWEEEYLKDVCKIVYGKNLPKTKLQDTGYYVFGANGVIGYYDKFLYKKPQILIGCRGTVGQVSISYPYSFITNNSLVIEYEESKFDLPYIHQSLQHMDIKGVSSGSVQPQITIQNMSELKILVPPLEIHNAYINKVKEIYELRLSYFFENKKIEKIRDELLPRLLKGEL